MSDVNFVLPSPIVDKKEQNSLIILTDKYERMMEPTAIKKAGNKAIKLIPEKVINIAHNTKDKLSENDLYIKAMGVVLEGFKLVEKTAAKFSISRKQIIEKVNSVTPDNEISTIEEICFARGYDIARIINNSNTLNQGLALVEGGATGAFGFMGLPFNIVLSIFLYYRAVQTVALFYGYDIKDDPAELEIAGEVFMNAMNPSSSNVNEVSNIIGKVMIMTETTAIKQAVKKGWTAMAEHGGAALLIVQMRALANKAAKKALEKAGEKELEETMFKGIFEQLGKRLTQKAVGRAVPVIGGVIGALFDTAQMKKVLDYANIFYNKRFIMDKEVRINDYLGIEDGIVYYEEIQEKEDED